MTPDARAAVDRAVCRVLNARYPDTSWAPVPPLPPADVRDTGEARANA